MSEGGGLAGKFQEGNESVSCDFLSHPAQDKHEQDNLSGAWTENPNLFLSPRHGLILHWIFLGWRKQFEGSQIRGEEHVRDNARPAYCTGLCSMRSLVGGRWK